MKQLLAALFASSLALGCVAPSDDIADNTSDEDVDDHEAAIDQIPFESEIDGVPVRLRVDHDDWSGHYDFETRKGTTRRVAVARDDGAFPLGEAIWSGRLDYMEPRDTEKGQSPPKHGGDYWMYDDGEGVVWEGCQPVPGTPYGDLLVCRWKSAKGSWHAYSDTTYMGQLVKLIADQSFASCIALLASLPSDTIPLTVPYELQVQAALTIDCGTWALGLL